MALFCIIKSKPELPEQLRAANYPQSAPTALFPKSATPTSRSNRLVSIPADGARPELTCRDPLDAAPLNRLTGADYSTGERFEYAYDGVGNRTAMTDTAGVHTYTYDAANRLTSVDGVAYTWDARGNLVGDGTFTYEFSAAGRLVRAESVTSTLVYTYNAAGLGVAQAVDGDATTFAWDWATGVPELLSDGDALYLVGHEALGWDGGAGWRYVLPDALGSVRQAVDGAGAVVDAREWSPYGVEVGGAQAGLGYTSEWWDAAVGLQYLRARWYDGLVGRFTQGDLWEGDIKEPQTLLQGYVYAVNNPVNFIDPSGQCRCGPKVDEWFAQEFDIWRKQMHRVRFKPRILSYIFAVAACARETYNVIDFVHWGGAPLYKNIDFNYADDHDRTGVCPSPRRNGNNGEYLSPDEYIDKIDRGTIRPFDVCGGGSVTLFGHCINSSELGNFMTGYIAYHHDLMYLLSGPPCPSQNCLSSYSMVTTQAATFREATRISSPVRNYTNRNLPAFRKLRSFPEGSCVQAE